MTRRSVLVSLAATPTILGQKRKSSAKDAPEIEVLDATAFVEAGRINVDGHVRNVTAKPIRKLLVFYEILDSDNRVLTRQHGPIEQYELEPGEDVGFQVQMAYHARSVSFRLAFEDAAGRELRAEKSGPFPIEQ